MLSNRLFQILFLLLNKKKITAKELSEKFEVSTRTIYRDVDALSLAGIPIYTNRGKNGGIELMEQFTMPKALLSLEEQNEILSALMSFSLLQAPHNSDVIDKLSALFGHSPDNWLSIDFSSWGNCQNDIFPILKQSILEHKTITFDYFNSSGQKLNRTIEPLRLHFREKAWYLYGFCQTRNGFRLFKLYRMQNVTQNSQTFLPKEIQMDQLIKASFTDFVHVTLELHASQAYRVYDEFYDSDVTIAPNHSFLIKTKLPTGTWLISYLLSFGKHLKVIQPDNLKKQLQTELTATLQQYEF